MLRLPPRVVLRWAGFLAGVAALARAEAPIDPGRFSWIASPEPDPGTSHLDLRDLNDPVAGARGPLRRTGDHLSWADGRPAKFWGLRIPEAALALDPAAMDRLARRLARAGVNLARIAPPLTATQPGGPAAMAGVAGLVAAFKREGVTTDLVLDADPAALLILPEAQARWRERARALLTLTGTGLKGRLGADPAVAFVETAGGGVLGPGFAAARVPELSWQKLENAFGDWTRSRYGGMERARAAWLEAREPGDDPSGGWMTLYDAWHLSREGLEGAGPGLRRRASDQARFLGELESRTLDGMVRFLRHDLGVRGLILLDRPVTVDPAVFDAPSQFVRGRADALGMAASFGASGDVDRTKGTGTFANRSAVELPEQSPFRLVRAAGQPEVITALSWPPPNLFRAEGPWLGAVLGSCSGWSAVIWDDAAGAFGDDEPEAPGTAAIFGSFPACAALFRSGMVRAAPTAVAQTIDPDDLWSLAATAREAVRPVAALAAGSGPLADLDPLAFAAGPVTRTFSARQPGERRADLAGAIDRSLHVIRSLTGEVVWDAGHGVIRVDTARAQGAAGFLSRLPAIALSSVTIDCENDNAAVLAVALDGAPLERSRRILIQVMTTDRPAGFRAGGGADGEIQAAGGSPWTVERLRCRVTLRGGDWSSGVVRALDPRGVPLEEQPKPVVAAGGSSLTFAAAPQGIVHLVTR